LKKATPRVDLRLTRRFALPELPLRGKKKRKCHKWEGELTSEPKQRKRVLVLLGVYS